MKLRNVIKILLAVVLAVSLFFVGRQIYDDVRGERDYSDAAEMGGFDTADSVEAQPAPPHPEEAVDTVEETVWVDPYADALAAGDFKALQEVNDDVIGWIAIPDTGISYPLLYGSDNDYYLKHSWRSVRNSVGAIFVDCRNSSSMGDFNTVIYGHRMNNSSMFGRLHQYKKDGYFAAHPYVYIATEGGVSTYEIFAYYETGTMNTYSVAFADDAARQHFIDKCLAQAMLDTGIVPDTNDRIITLSTCTGQGHATRWVVQAVLRIDEPPAEEIDESDAPSDDAGEEDVSPDAPAEENGGENPNETAENSENGYASTEEVSPQ